MIESGSSLNCFRTCPKKYEFQYGERLTSPNYSNNIGYGNFVHHYRAMKHAVLNGFPVMPFERELTGFLNEQMRKYPEAEEQILADRDLAMRVVEEWSRYWQMNQTNLSEHNFRFSHIENEWSFSVGGHRHIGKSDGICHHLGWDKRFLYELKTATDRGSNAYLHRLALDSQINSNIIAASERGSPVDGVLYDIIWKPALRLKKDETKDQLNERIVEAYRESGSEYFERVTVNRTVAQLAEYRNELLVQFETLATLQKHPYRAMYRNPGACMNYNSLCPFFDLCMDPSMAEQRSSFLVRERQHPELSEEIQK